MLKMEWYLIQKLYGSLMSDDILVQAKNSKEALETFLGKKVKRDEKNPIFCVMASNEKGQVYKDRRKNVYYKTI